ncbi:MAG: hypothetical protein EHM79_08470 [Geobacter sp.]|nr:MAG: hypothetical protein EHM79_08470 [Geobacter sp.]
MKIRPVWAGWVVTEAPKKHPCPDCLCCQWCSDSRCGMCLRQRGCTRKKLSLQEQIALYEKINKSESRE